MSQAWEDGGCFVILGETLFNPPAFESDLSSFLGQAAQSGVRFLWITNPNLNSSTWQVSSIKFANHTSTTGTISADAQIAFRNLALFLPNGSGITLNLKDNCFQLTNASVVSPQITFKEISANETVPVVSGVNIPFYGQAGSGCLRFNIGADESDLDTLDVGLRYFTDDPQTAGLLVSRRYPVFNIQAMSVTLYANLDPCHHLDPSKTYFAFSQSPLSAAVALNTYFSTTLGYGLTLTPQSQASLVFAVKPASVTPNASNPFYLVPQGNFEVGVNRTGGLTPADKLMCGLSGSEYIPLSGVSSVQMTFAPGCNAYAPSFVAGEVTSAASNYKHLSNHERLIGTATTAWIYLQAGGLTYYAQPEGAEYHQPIGATEFLSVMEIPSGSLPILETLSAAAFPMTPYLGLQDSLTDYRDFELRVLSPERRSRIFRLNAVLKHPLRTYRIAAKASSAAAPAPSSVSSAAASQTPSSQTSSGLTPQGFLATFSPDLQSWQLLTLAQDSTGAPLAFADIADSLKAALQTNQQFLVISNPSILTQHFPGHQVVIEGWNFDLDPGNWDDHQTVMIFKFYSNKSVLDCVNDLSTWAQADSFNTDPATTQTAVQTIINNAMTLQSEGPPDGGDANYDNFVSTVTDESWNGILVLNCTVPLTGLPPELEGLAAGIDPTQFYAHHLGVEVTPTTNNGALQMGHSSFFGLIDYSVPVNLTTTDDYSFQVDTLVVLIENSTIKNFASTIDILVNKLFGESCTLVTVTPPAASPSVTPAAANIITLQGQYESHDGQPCYSFTSSQKNVFEMSSTILEAVEIVQSQYVTLVPSTGYQSSQPVMSSFLFSGNLSFKLIEDLDLFSYDALPFSNLAVDITFDPRYPDTPPTYAFDSTKMSVSATGSAARPNSLADQFPLQVAGFATGAGQSPQSLGYLSVQMPSEFAGLGDDWYAVMFDLNLGSLGALSSQKSFTATLLTAWTPSGPPGGNNTHYPADVELKLPFSDSSQQQFSIEDVLKLSIKSIELYKQESAYLMKFRDIALKFIGISLPPGGTTDLYLFGDPGAKASSLAWYAAYAEKEKKRKKL